MRVLVVDDDPLLARCFSRMLEKRGAAVDKAVSAAVARHLLEGSLDEVDPDPYDVVLSDVDMPGGSGFDLVAWMREREYPGKALLMSADTVTGDRQARARRLGVKLFDKADEQEAIMDEVAALAAVKVCW